MVSCSSLFPKSLWVLCGGGNVSFPCVSVLCFVYRQHVLSGQRRKQYGNITVKLLTIYKRARERKCVVLGGQIQVNQGSVTCHLPPHTSTPTRQSFTAGDSPAVRRLELCDSAAGLQVQALTGEIRSHKPSSSIPKQTKQKKKKKKHKQTKNHFTAFLYTLGPKILPIKRGQQMAFLKQDHNRISHLMCCLEPCCSPTKRWSLIPLLLHLGRFVPHL